MEEATKCTGYCTCTEDCGVTISNLNDDCLLEIFKRLGLAEQVRLAVLCPRLSSFFQYYSERYSKVLTKDDIGHMTEPEVKYFFSMAGKYMEEIIDLPCSDGKRNDLIKWVNAYCFNTRKIYIGETKVTAKCLRKMLGNMRHLTRLELVDCSLDDNAMLAIADSSTLECLRLEKEANITGCHLSKLKNLSELAFIECNLENKYLIKICRSSKKLRKLEVVWCELVSDVAISQLPAYCPALEAIRIGCLDRLKLSPLAQLPQLRDVEVADDYADSLRQLFDSLAAQKSEQLECLRIHCCRLLINDYLNTLTRLKQIKLFTLDCSNYLTDAALQCLCRFTYLETISLRYCKLITNQAVLTLLKDCKKLKYVNVMYCEQLTECLVFDIIAMLQEQLNSGERTKCDVPMLMLVAGTQINNSILKHPKYLEAAKLMRLSFITPFREVCENRYIIFMPNNDELKYFY